MKMKFMICGIPYYFKEGDLAHYFRQQGIEALNIEIAEDNGRPRGFAYFQLDLTPLEGIAFLNRDFTCKGQHVRVECVDEPKDILKEAGIFHELDLSFDEPASEPPKKICQYCPSTDFLKIEVDKAYRRGGTAYYRGTDGERWLCDEFNLETPLSGLIVAGDILLTLCLDCFRIQDFQLSAEQKQSLIKEHLESGYNPKEAERQKLARQEENRKEREAKQTLYNKWRPEYYLYIFYDKDQDKNRFYDLEQSVAEFGGRVALAKLEWSSTAAFKPKIRYNINSLDQCCLTDSRGGDIVRLPVPKDVSELTSMLDSLGYRREAKTILDGFYEQ